MNSSSNAYNNGGGSQSGSRSQSAVVVASGNDSKSHADESVDTPHVVHHSATEKTFSIITYSCASISMILLNKIVIDTYKLNYPMGLLMLQKITALSLVMFAKKKRWVHYPDFELRVAVKWLPLTGFFVLMLWTSMKSLLLMSVAAQTIIKNLAIIVTAMGDRYLFAREVTAPMYGAFALMVLGSYVGATGDPWVTSEGVFWTVCNIICTVSYVLYMKLLLKSVSDEIGRYGPVFYSNLLALPFVALASLPTVTDMFADLSVLGQAGWVSLILMLVAGSVITFASFWCMHMTSPTTFSVTGALNKVPLAFLGIFIFGHYPSSSGYVGIGIALSGGVFYTWLNTKKSIPSSQNGNTAKRSYV